MFLGETLLFDERPNEAASGVSWDVFGTNAAFPSNGGQLSISLALPGLEVERRILFERGTRRFLVKVLYDTSLSPATDSWDAPGTFTLRAVCSSSLGVHNCL